jgi:TonB family protein
MIVSVRSVVSVVAACLAACGGSSTAPPPQTPASASVTAPPVVEVSEEPAPLVTGEAGALDPDAPKSPGGLTDEQVMSTMQKNKGALQACFEAQRAAHPTLAGTVRVEWITSSAGHVRSASVLSSTLGNPDVEACLVAEVKKLSFPRAADGLPTTIRFPFAFQASPPPDAKPAAKPPTK